MSGDEGENIKINQQQQPGTYTGEVAGHAKLNLQQFWPQQPNNWFRLAEIQFELRGITSEKSKYAHVLATLSPDICDTLSDFLQKPPKDNHYTSLKRTLLERLVPSDERRLEALLSGQDLGDRRPSEALRHLKNLAGPNTVNDTIIRAIWIKKLPEVIRIAIVAQPEHTTSEELAKIADKMHEVITVQSIQALHTSQPIQSRQPSLSNQNNNQNYTTRQNHPSNTQTNSVENRLARIEARLAGLFRTSRSRSRGRSSTNRSQSRDSAQSVNNRMGKCWYHAKHGAAARKCTPPCILHKTPPAINRMEVDTNSKNM